MGGVDREEIKRWIEQMKSLQLAFGDIGVTKGDSFESDVFSIDPQPFLAELQHLRAQLRDMSIPKDKDCKRATKLFERAIDARIKGYNIIGKIEKYTESGARPSRRTGAASIGFWLSIQKDTLRDSIKAIASVYEKYQI